MKKVHFYSHVHTLQSCMPFLHFSDQCVHATAQYCQHLDYLCNVLIGNPMAG